MEASESHRRLAGKFVLENMFEGVLVADSLISLVRLAYTEEEAAVVCELGVTPVPAAVIARRVDRPRSEVEPILKSLSDRLLIAGVEAVGMKIYGFLPMVPGVFEAQMVRSKTDPENPKYYREFARLYHETHEEYGRYFSTRIAHKDLRFSRIIPVNQSIQNKTGIVPLFTDYYSEIVDRNKSFCILHACACRQEYTLLGQSCGKPLDVCSTMGWLADLCIDKGLARRVSREEFLEAKARATEAGLVNLADNLQDPLQVCSCCSCCCTGLRMIKRHNVPTIVAKSHFEARVDEAACIGCRKCAKICPMDAITVDKEAKKAKIDYARCIGCGLCVVKCEKTHAMTLRERKGHKPPSSTILDFVADRYAEVMGAEGSSVAKMGLGLGRMLAKVSPLAITGPRYQPKDYR
ncbi:MAG: 4Fe-4S dicluster-binding protein [Thermodesulfobacteriota bacterium]